MTRVAGHALRYEGMAVHSASCHETPCYGMRDGVRHPYQRGHAVCSCGEMSPHLATGGQRKRWHREHKVAVVAGAVEGGDGG